MFSVKFPDTHIYPGCLALFLFKIDSHHQSGSIRVEFSDGIVTGAEIEAVSTKEVLLHLDSYTTSHGTHTPAKTWQLEYVADQDLWKVTGRLTKRALPRESLN